jgi:exoribonuclease-2
MNANELNDRVILTKIADRAMREQGLQPKFSREALAELETIQSAAKTGTAVPAHGSTNVRDMRNLLWASIDNDDSLDLDQISVAEAMPEGRNKVFVAIADVDSLVKNGSAIDEHARHNTTSVYTAAMIYPMLPEKLSTDLTSLKFNEDRLSFVIEMVINADGSLESSDIYRALVRNRAKLAYDSVAAWLEDSGPAPVEITEIHGLAENLRLQDRIAQKLKNFRQAQGALSLETIEAKPVFDGDQIRSLEVEEENRAKQIIEDFMIASNGVTARYLTAHQFPSIRRVVRIPKRWDRIVEIAEKNNYKLPTIPNSKALEEFLLSQKAANPLHFPDLSLVIIKLMGAGEYVAELPNKDVPGHFGLAVKDYSHSTAPNRRFPDLLTQRLIKAALSNQPIPYDNDELNVLAKHCTEAEDAADKVERLVEKSAAALLLKSRIGERFDSIVTGISDRGTWVRLLTIPVEGELVHGFDGLKMGENIRVQLIAVNVDRGFIDFKKVSYSR